MNDINARLIKSKRMTMIAGLCVTRRVLADVGCDHAYISIYLAGMGTAEKIYAMDINEGPLARANENIEAAGLSDRISTILSDGLEKLPGDVDEVIISGMGGILMSRILKDGRDKLEKTSVLVLQPQSDREILRSTVVELGYMIEDEADCFDEGKYYQCIRAVKGEASYDETELEFGPVLTGRKSENLSEYLRLRKEKLGKIIEGIKSRGSVNPEDGVFSEYARIEKAAERVCR